MASDHFPERRQYKRIKKHFILTYYDSAHPDEKFGASQLKNISLGGMCLITAKEFPEKTLLAIELKTPFMTDLTHMEGIVLSSREQMKDIIYETRIQFSELTPEAHFVLSKIIGHYEQEENEDEQ